MTYQKSHQDIITKILEDGYMFLGGIKIYAYEEDYGWRVLKENVQLSSLPIKFDAQKDEYVLDGLQESNQALDIQNLDELKIKGIYSVRKYRDEMDCLYAQTQELCYFVEFTYKHLNYMLFSTASISKGRNLTLCEVEPSVIGNTYKCIASEDIERNYSLLQKSYIHGTGENDVKTLVKSMTYHHLIQSVYSPLYDEIKNKQDKIKEEMDKLNKQQEDIKDEIMASFDIE